MKATRTDYLLARELALDAGSLLTAPVRRSNAAQVTIRARPVEDWLLGNGWDGDAAELELRTRALRRHLGNLADAEKTGPAARASLLTTEAFLAGVEQYYGMLNQLPPAGSS
jgi:hypothetical protein